MKRVFQNRVLWLMFRIGMGRGIFSFVLRFLLVLPLTVIPLNCSTGGDDPATLLTIPISVIQNSNSTSLGLTASVATNITVSVSGCSSGNTTNPVLVTSGTISLLYQADQNCLVKLQTFQFGSTIYSATATGATNFTTWLAADIATFANTTLSTDLIKVYVTQQVTQSGVLSADRVSYNFTDSQQGTNQNLAQAYVGNGIALPSASSEAVPNFSVTQSRYLGIDAASRLQFAFTLQCGSSMTGSSNSTYACSGILLQSEIQYIFIPDIYSQGAITYAQADVAFADATNVSVGSNIVAPAGNDGSGNTLTNGGFYTSNTTPLITSPFPASGANYVLMIRSTDSSGDTLAYLYFYVDVTLNNVF